MNYQLIYKGSVDDIKMHLRYVEEEMSIADLQREIDGEMKHLCRTSVINMINAAIKRKMKKESKC
jgi:hypothetical protein